MSEIDYKAVLFKYLRLVRVNEGTDFVSDDLSAAWERDTFTRHEWVALVELAKASRE